MKKIALFIFVLLLVSVSSVYAVECNSNLNNTPCDVTADLTLDTAGYSIADGDIVIYNGIFDGADSTLTSE